MTWRPSVRLRSGWSSSAASTIASRPCQIWADAKYGPVPNMGRCQIWNRSAGAGRHRVRQAREQRRRRRAGRGEGCGPPQGRGQAHGQVVVGHVARVHRQRVLVVLDRDALHLPY
eukprot:5061442-Prymnesium_polylepis.1